jgi:large subunit ribosomal protein L3
MKYILGTKEKMTQVFDKNGTVSAVTLISAEPATVIDLKTKEKDGYDSVVVGFGTKSVKKIAKPQKGVFKDMGNFRYVREFKTTDSFSVGDKISIDKLQEGEIVEVTGITKGKGFQGVVKRHGFAGGRRTHGQKHSEREPGSIGAGGVQRVMKGLRMAGRMGGDRVTVKNLRVVTVDSSKNILAVSGAIPGRKGTLLEIKVK